MKQIFSLRFILGIVIFLSSCSLNEEPISNIVFREVLIPPVLKYYTRDEMLIAV